MQRDGMVFADSDLVLRNCCFMHAQMSTKNFFIQKCHTSCCGSFVLSDGSIVPFDGNSIVLHHHLLTMILQTRGLQ